MSEASSSSSGRSSGSGASSAAGTPPPVVCDRPRPRVRRITLARPDRRNAQDSDLLYALNDAFDDAAHDDSVSVIVLAAQGRDFSAGHDVNWTWDLERFATVSPWGGFDRPGAEGQLAREEELFLGLCLRWRNIPKPTIAAVQGRVIGGGLMLVWPCDLVIAADTATFSDPTVALAINGVEYLAHPWELGPRRAKELLFRGRAITAAEAHRLGMVNHVTDPAKLESFTLDIAAEIAEQPTMGLTLAKQAVNQAMDAAGFTHSLQAAFSLHQLGHSHNMQRHNSLGDPAGVMRMRALLRRDPLA